MKEKRYTYPEFLVEFSTKTEEQKSSWWLELVCERVNNDPAALGREVARAIGKTIEKRLLEELRMKYA